MTAVGSNLSMSYAYDGNGKRVKTFNSVTNQTTVFVYDTDGDLAAEYTVNAPAPTNPTISYLTEDALGSVRITTNSFGEVKARRDFLPFGEEIYASIGNRTTNQKYSSNTDDTRKKFATYQRDEETKLDFAQSRYYSPMQGRFTSPDEFKGGPDELFDFEEDASDNPTFYGDLENPQSLNKYQYTYNNPYKYNDPNGHCPPCALAPLAPIAIPVVEIITTAIAGTLIGGAVGTVVGTSTRTPDAALGDGSCPSCDRNLRAAQNKFNQQANQNKNQPTPQVTQGKITAGATNKVTTPTQRKKNAAGKTSSGNLTDNKGRILGGSGKTRQYTVKPKSVKEAKNSVRRTKGSRSSVEHKKDRYNGKGVANHLHSVDKNGKKIDNKVHTYLPKKRQGPTN